MRIRAWMLAFGVLLAAAPVGAQSLPDTVVSQAATFTVEVLLSGLEAPVAMAFLPDGRAVLAQRATGEFSLVDVEARTIVPIGDGPPVFVAGDGGALDVLVDPDFDANGRIYLAYSAGTAQGSSTVLDRARLVDGRFVDRERLFTAAPLVEEAAHYGGRVALHEGHLFLSVGDREPRARPGREQAQSVASHSGSIVRIRPDGTVPRDNPFVDTPGALPEIWSYGHRNPQGLAANPGTGTLWANEHGPQGGDELNVVSRGANYGWPVVSFGEEYQGGPVGSGESARPGMAAPIYFYRPSIAPSDMAFVTGAEFAGWRGSALVGALGLRHLNRLTLDGDRVLHEERLLEGRDWRVRMVEEGPDGRIYLATDSGLLVRLAAARQR